MGVPTISYKIVTPIDKLKADLKEVERTTKSIGKEIEKNAKAGKDTTALNRQFAQSNARAATLRRQFTLAKEAQEAAGGDTLFDAKEDFDAFDVRKQVGMRIRGFLKSSRLGTSALRGFQALRSSGAFGFAARAGIYGAIAASAFKGLNAIGSDDTATLDAEQDIETAKLLGQDTDSMERRKARMDVTNSRLYRAPKAALGWVPVVGGLVEKAADTAANLEAYVKGVDETSLTKQDMKDYLKKTNLRGSQIDAITERNLEQMGGNSRFSRQMRGLKNLGREVLGNGRVADYIFDNAEDTKTLFERTKKDIEVSNKLAEEGWKMVSNNNIDDALAVFQKSADLVKGGATDPVQAWMNMESSRANNIRYAQSCIKSPPARLGS